MDDVIERLRNIDGVKTVKKYSGATLKIDLFSKPIPNNDAEEISGDLRKISQRIISILDDAREEGCFTNWEWIIKPEKQYQETSFGRISDRKSKGHNPSFYRVNIQQE